MDRLYSRAVNQLSDFLGEEFKGSYYRTMYDLQTVNGFGSNFSTINAELVEKTLAYPWSGANFFDRLWKNKNVLINTMRETLTQGMIRGDNIRDMTKAIAEKLGSSLKNAERVVRTETSHIHNTAEIEAYKAGGYEEYEYMASFGEKTCGKCGGLDGQHFKLADIQYGVNFPPVHTNCRCTTVCWDEADEEHKALEGQKALDYEEWYKKYVEGREQPKLESKDGAAVEIPKQPVPAIPTGENKTASQTLTTGENNDIMRMGKVKNGRTQKVPDFSKYNVVDDAEGVAKLKSFISNELHVTEGDIDISKLRNAEVARPFMEQLKKAQTECGLKMPKIVATELIEGDERCIAGFKPFENTLYLSSRYFNSKDAFLDAINDWARN